MITAFFSGAVGAIFSNPFELVLILRICHPEVYDSLNNLQSISYIIKSKGWFGLTTGYL